MAVSDKIRVLLVDDQPAVRRGLRMWLSLEPDVAVVGEAGGGDAALPLVERERPDVVLMDVQMPGRDGIATTAALRSLAPGTAVIMLSLYDDAATLARARAAGACAFVAKHEAERLLVPAIRRAAAG